MKRLLVLLLFLLGTLGVFADAPPDITERVLNQNVAVYCHPNLFASYDGSGFICKIDGDSTYVITCNHCIHDKVPEKVKFFPEKGKCEKSDIVSQDPDKDLAMLKVQTVPGTAAVTLATPEDLVPAPQYIFNETNDFGYVYGKYFGDLEYPIGKWGNRMEVNLTLRHGMSGSAVFNNEGKVIGVSELGNGDNGSDIGFLIPVQYVKDFMVSVGK